MDDSCCRWICGFAVSETRNLSTTGLLVGCTGLQCGRTILEDSLSWTANEVI